MAALQELECQPLAGEPHGQPLRFVRSPWASGPAAVAASRAAARWLCDFGKPRALPASFVQTRVGCDAVLSQLPECSGETGGTRVERGAGEFDAALLDHAALSFPLAPPVLFLDGGLVESQSSAV